MYWIYLIYFHVDFLNTSIIRLKMVVMLVSVIMEIKRNRMASIADNSTRLFEAVMVV